MTKIDIRCPAGNRNLFARVNEQGLWEVACPTCRRTLRAVGADVRHVLHVYKPSGEYLETRTVLNSDAADTPE